MNKKDIDTNLTNNIICPYCGYEHHPTEDANHYYTEDLTETDCDRCGKEFEFNGTNLWYFSSYKKELENE